MEGHWKFLGVGGSAKFLEAMYENKPEFPGGEGGGAKQKNLPWGEYGHFLELHNISYMCNIACNAMCNVKPANFF